MWSTAFNFPVFRELRRQTDILFEVRVRRVGWTLSVPRLPARGFEFGHFPRLSAARGSAQSLTHLVRKVAFCAPAPAGQYVCSESHHALPAPAEPNVSPILPTETRILP